MYSPLIVERNLHSLSIPPLYRRSVWEAREFVDAMDKSIDPTTGSLTRGLTNGEAAFIKSETLLCQHDFRYWAERYGYMELDAMTGGGVGLATFWGSQNRALDLIGKREEEAWASYDKHGFGEGILTLWHKARQLGATAVMRLISLHRMTLHKNTRLIAASLDETKVHELYTRDKIVLDNLPFFFRPKVEFDVKDQHLSLDLIKSRLTYQQANQQAGIGTGSQFDMFHFTEVAMWAWADRLKFDFLPAVPKHPKVFGALESTANGRGNFWHEFSENVRKREYGYESWIYIFAPYYVEPTKYRRAAPDDWRPNQVTMQHADMVEQTSPDVIGRTQTLTRDQMYWWETEREMYRKDGSLNVFLTDYCATPEESFQHSTQSALPEETIEWMRAMSAIKGIPYLPTDLSFRA